MAEANEVNRQPDGKYAALDVFESLDMNENIVSNIEGVTAKTSQDEVFTVSDGSGGSNSTPYTFRFDQPRNFRFRSNNAGDVLEFDHAGDVNAPSGVLSEQGNRVATRFWTQSSAPSIPNDALTNSDVTITATGGLESGGSVSLGGSVSIDVDEGASFSWTGIHNFDGGLNIGTDVDLEGTSRITNAPSPQDSADLARKSYVDNTVEGATDVKDSVALSPVGNVDLASSTDPNPVDGQTLNDGDRVLLQDQTDASENGIYDAVTATDPTTWVRSSDANEDSEFQSGVFVFVDTGTQHGNSSFIVKNDGDITLGTTDIEIAQFSSAGAIDGGKGLKKSGQTLSIEPADFVGTFLSDDGSDNIDVDIGRGLESDGSNNLRVDEDTDYTFSSTIDFTAGLDTSSNITDGATVIWNSSAGYVEQSSLQNDSVTVTAGVDLTTGGSVALGNTVTVDHADTSSQSDFSASAGEAITDINVDGRGHTTSISATDLDTRYVTEFGDTMSGNLNMDGSNVSNVGILSLDDSDGDGDTFQLEEVSGAFELNRDDGVSLYSTSYIGSHTLRNGSGQDTMSLDSNGALTLLRGGLTVDSDSDIADYQHLTPSGDGTESRITTPSGPQNITVYDRTNSNDIARFVPGGDVEIPNGDLTDGTNTIYDASATEVPQARLGGPSSSLSAYPLANGDLANSSVTINANDGLKSGGSVSLGGSVGLDIDVSDFAGSGVQDDGSENIELVNDSVTVAGNVVTLGGSTNVATEDLTSDTDGLTEGTNNLFYTDERAQDGVGGILGGNFTYDDGANTITLTSDSVTINANDGLKSGGSVALGGSVGLDIEPADFAGSGVQDDGSDNLELVNDSVAVTAGNALTGGGTVSLGGSTTIDVDESLINADQVDGFDIQKNGTDGTGIINFKTS